MSGLRRSLAVVAVTLVGGALTLPVQAREFDSFIVVDSEEDLYDLFDDGTIDEQEQEVLLELLETGVNLNRAGRDELYSLPNLTLPVVDAILAYRTEAGGIDNPAALVGAGLITVEELMALAPFLLLVKEEGVAFGTKGWARFETLVVGGESRVPGMKLQARASAIGGFRSGVAALLTRDRLGRVSYDSQRDTPTSRALIANRPAPRVQLAKAFVEWQEEDFGLIAGTYKIGFGQRLTFDNTGDYRPNGFEKDDTVTRDTSLKTACKESTGLTDSPLCDQGDDLRISPDYRWIPRLLGVAGGHRRIDMGVGHLQAFGFASFQRRSIYQYDVLDRETCSVADEEAGNCDFSSDFNVYVDDTDSTAGTPEFKYTTLTGLYNELVIGGNVAYWFGERARVGLTGYGAAPFWRVPQMQLDFRKAARWPFGGPWGAVGMNGTIGFAWWDLGMELTRTIDSQSLGGGDFGAIVRGLGSWKKRELELSLRYYGPNFANPYARPISAADERDGLRARDEAGGRVKFTGKLLRNLELRGTSDLWATLSTGILNTRNEVRATYRLTDAIRLSAWGLFQDKNLSVGGREQCYETYSGAREVIFTPDGRTIDGCAGMKLQATAQVRYEPFKNTAITLQYRNSWLDENAASGREIFDDRMRQDRSFWATVMVKPIPDLRIRARLRYLLEDVSFNDHLESWIWAYLELTYNLQKRYKFRLRYDLVSWLDQRSSTQTRTPDPEHWLWFTLEAKF